jgi:hypothetical protein
MEMACSSGVGRVALAEPAIDARHLKDQSQLAAGARK